MNSAAQSGNQAAPATIPDSAREERRCLKSHAAGYIQATNLCDSSILQQRSVI